MQTLNIVKGAKAQGIAIELIALIQSDNCLSAYVAEEETISQVMSAIDITKRHLKKEGKLLNIQPIHSQQKTVSGEPGQGMTFRIIAASLSPMSLSNS